MRNAVFRIDTQAATFTPANATADELVLDWPDSANAWPLDVFSENPDNIVSSDGSGARWWRMPSGRRIWTELIGVATIETDESALLVLRSASDEELDATAFQSWGTLLTAYQNGASASSILKHLCELLSVSLELAMIRTLRVEGSSFKSCALHSNDELIDAKLHTLEQPGLPDDFSEAASALRSSQSIFNEIDLSTHSQWRRSLYLLGVRGSLAFLLEGLEHSYVLELFSFGAEDFKEPKLKAFIQRWIPWISQQLLACTQRRGETLLADALQGASTAAFITDMMGVILWVNKAFYKTYGYPKKDVLGHTPRILQSGRHGALYYERLWAELRAGRAWSGETTDRTADQHLVTVRQHITPVWHDGKVTHFLSIQSDMTSEAALAAITDQQKGVDELTDLLTQAAFEERCRGMLARANAKGRTPALLLMCIQTRNGTPPQLNADALAFARAVIGERIKSVIGKSIIGSVLAGFDFAFLLPHPKRQLPRLRNDLVELLNSPLLLLGRTVELSCIFGDSRYPADGKSFDELRHSAEGRILVESKMMA